ncbi:hypothetical protein MtrunA17_Chr7g0217151 [Medicago truncatula]|uniref:Uncharacterized protein n=1 Tax=Medicago truncatula TaxID=3880 RepID=G7KZY6_MEDTR|nr:hypothetical protein MTR_7g010130 [Medicago truncatula]RHN44234.1 hypothetical protein MtrunA17_Chr7g0217151 [Medicago truncatula]
MVSEPLRNPLGHLLSGFRYWTTYRLCPRTKRNSAGRERCVKSPTSVRRWTDNVFISGGNPNPTSRFLRVVLGPTTISKRFILQRDHLKVLLLDHAS